MTTTGAGEALPLIGNFTVLPRTDDRGLSSRSLYIDYDQGAVVRSLPDTLEEEPASLERLQQRAHLLREFGGFVCVSSWIGTWGEAGSTVISRYVEGPTLNARLRTMTEDYDPDKDEAVLTSLSGHNQALAAYYVPRILKQEPVLLDTIKSNQWIVQEEGAEPPVLTFIDHDMYAFGNRDEYTPLDIALLTEMVSAPAGLSAVYMANLAKSNPQIDYSLVKPAVEAVLSILETIESERLEPSRDSRYNRQLLRIARDSLATSRLDNQAMYKMQRVYDKIVRTRQQCMKQARVSAKI